jgi:nucleoside-diphosphate-sugar epimerase
MTYIDNAVDAVLLAMDADPGLSGEKYNITNDEPFMFREMVAKLFQGLQKEIRIASLPYALVFKVGAALEFLYRHLPTDQKPFITRYRVGLVGTSQTHDVTKAQTQLGYTPQVSLDEGFRRFAAYWKAQTGQH